MCTKNKETTPSAVSIGNPCDCQTFNVVSRFFDDHVHMYWKFSFSGAAEFKQDVNINGL